MYDEFTGRHIVSIGAFQFVSSRYEVWSGGKMISSDEDESVLSYATDASKFPTENGIEISVSSNLDESIIAKKIFFDVGYTNKDRILFAIIPSQSNCDHIDSFKSFVINAPFHTRHEKKFNSNEPHACSIFLKNGSIDKITFSTALSRILLEFYK